MATVTAVDIKNKVLELQEQVLAAHPRMPVLLQEIHKILKADPDNITLLDDEDIGIIVSGLAQHAKVEIVAAAIKTPKKAALKNVNVDML